MLIHPDFDPVAIAIGPLKVHWYGLTYLAAFAAVWWLGRRRVGLGLAPLDREQFDDMLFWGALGVIFGGRVGYALFYNFDRVLSEPVWLIKVWQGGMSFHGGLLGVIIALGWFAHRHRISPWALWDFVAPLVPVGLGLGRIGNFIGQELWGRPTTLPWGMVFPRDPLALARHPSQLYQAFLEGLLLFTLLYWFSSRPRPLYTAGGLFLLLYGLARFMVEFVREPDHHLGFVALGWLTRGQLLSLPMMAFGIGMLAVGFRSARPGIRGTLK